MNSFLTLDFFFLLLWFEKELKEIKTTKYKSFEILYIHLKNILSDFIHIYDL